MQPDEKRELIKFCIEAILKAEYEYTNFGKLVDAANSMADLIILKSNS